MSNQCYQKSDKSDTTPPKPIERPVFERLHNRLQQKHIDPVSDRQHQLLEALGQHLRQWRIKQGYSRQELAEKLQLSVDQLLCIENGIGVPGDITDPQLYILTTLLKEDEADRSLKESIRYYLTSFKP